MKLNIQTVALLLVIVGAINWGSVAYNGNDMVKLMVPAPYERYVKYMVAAAGMFLAYRLVQTSML
jgi:uncharacterized membrane protein YuzA (DUF378 family)